MNQLMHTNKMNQLLEEKQDIQISNTFHSIIVNIIVDMITNKLKMQLRIDPKIPFNAFIQNIMGYIIQDRLIYLYEQKFQYVLENSVNISQNESSSLIKLGFTNNCELYISFLIGTPFNIPILVNVDLQFEKIQFYLIQSFIAPISCIFHDILNEIYNRKKFQTIAYFKFFIGGREIDPFNPQRLDNYSLEQEINLKIIPRNKKPTQQEIDKINCLFTNKRYENSQIIINQLERDTQEYFKVYLTNTQQLIQFYKFKPISHLQNMLHEIVLEKDYGILRENNLKWYINGEQIYNIDNIYSNTNLQMDVKQSQQFQSLFIYLTGNFKEKIRINLYSPNLYYYDEYLPLDTLKDKDALANYLILKIFGPNLVEKDISVLDISYGGSEIYIEYNFKCNN